MAKLISRNIADAFEVLINEEILGLYSSNPEFARFLTEYLEAVPHWLRQNQPLSCNLPLSQPH